MRYLLPLLPTHQPLFSRVQAFQSLIPPLSLIARNKERILLSPSFCTSALNPQEKEQNMQQQRQRQQPRVIPSRPYCYNNFSGNQKDSFELLDLGTVVAESEARRQDSFDVARKLQAALVRAKHSLENGSSYIKADTDEEGTTNDSKSNDIEYNYVESADISKLNSLILESIPSTADRAPKENFLANRVEDYVRFQAFIHFLGTGKLLPPSSCTYATDEEYLAGACMGVCDDLARYGRGRSTARDVTSVKMANNLVSQILDYLLEFDFRNGPLRRRYDGTKYCLRTLETLLYELAVTGMELNDAEVDAQRAQPNDLIPMDELLPLKKRIEDRDELRENLIKRCRDGQKAAKQSIYALHRNDKRRAISLLETCESIITKDLVPIVQEEPPLRQAGSYTSLLEEYAEAKLFLAWLDSDKAVATTEATSDTKINYPSGNLLKPDDFKLVALDPAEYLGGLADLTGEIGRYAVQRATARDEERVKLSLQSNALILIALQTMERLPGGVGKKLEMVRRSVDKLERILYEMSLTDATGGRNVVHDDIDTEPKDKDTSADGV